MATSSISSVTDATSVTSSATMLSTLGLQRFDVQRHDVALHNDAPRDGRRPHDEEQHDGTDSYIQFGAARRVRLQLRSRR